MKKFYDFLFLFYGAASLVGLIILAFGCASNGGARMVADRQDRAAIANPQHGMCWQTGGYSNFVALASDDLTHWQVLAITDQTNVLFDFDRPQRFFAVYGTNANGQSAWATTP
jgi:hypothetical protein